MTTENRPELADPAASYARALDSTRAFVAGLGNLDWDAPTPCSEWSVRDLLQHIIYGTIWIEDVFAGKTVEQVGDKYGVELIGADALASYEAAANAAKAAIVAPGAMDQVCHLKRGDVKGSDYLTSMFTDAFIHGWDLAKATGQDASLDPELVETCYALAKAREERFRSSPAFGQGRVDDPGDDADAQARMLSILGREADWHA
jgi:uncharacterized protein (TIGR03086 family)